VPSIWNGTDTASGGQCMVAWKRVTHPVELGGLRILDLATMGYAFRLRWEWLVLSDPQRLWMHLPNKAESIVHSMFQASVTVQVGDGARALFWSDRWLDGASIQQLTPEVVAYVHPSARASLESGSRCSSWLLMDPEHLWCALHHRCFSVHFTMVLIGRGSAKPRGIR
jgi:hypothetical protein